LTASRDLRLEVRATDPDGDILQLRTWWNIDGHEFETVSPRLPKAKLYRGATLTARVVAFDGSHESAAFVTKTIVVENAAPVITTFPGHFDGLETFVYPIAAIDPDGDRGLQYHLANGPAGMVIKPDEGTLTWQPGSEQNGRHTVRLEVRDGQGGVQHQVFDLYVRPRTLATHQATRQTAKR
jgi:hypothetical protein